MLRVSVLAAIVTCGAGCSNRPVADSPPVAGGTFHTEVLEAPTITKVDLLFMIDNSPSMGDKQALLARAVPELMTRLVSPNCVDASGAPTGQTTIDGTCTTGKAEFQPVHDLHVGVVSSSLGGRGSDACDPLQKSPVNPSLSRHNDDRGHLLARVGDDEHDVSDASINDDFLAWFPSSPNNTADAAPNKAIAFATTLGSDFADLVAGVHEYGCGFEAQLESWYRFLIQPDPYDSIGGMPGKATLIGVDQTILQQRHDFLRPDSLVAIILLTDENDSTVDPMSVGGQGWFYENSKFPTSPTGGAPRGTSACNTTPDDPACTSCGYDQTPTDPSCQIDGGYYDPKTEDILNARFFHMKQRFGVDPQFPITRYTNALQSPRVPDRDGEHPKGSNNYVGTNDCGNPLYSQSLPDGAAAGDSDALCNLPKGPRSKDLVFFGVIGGVPWQLLLVDPTKPDSSEFKSALTDLDWTPILGASPLTYDFRSADPHMIESIVPRDAQYQTLKPTTAADDADPYNGREWETGGGDLQYACTFDLPTPKDCADPKNTNACDCNANRATNPPLCASATSTIQTRGKAYPTIREFSVVRALGDQGIAASLCPRSLDPNNRDYGYRPAMRAIVDHVKPALANTCLPHALAPDATGTVPCVILLTLEDAPGGEERCDPARGLSVPDAALLSKAREDAQTAFTAGGGEAAGLSDPSQYAICALTQLVGAPSTGCASQSEAGWCYAQNTTPTVNSRGGYCAQAIQFTPAGTIDRAKISLQCIDSNSGRGG